MCTCKIAATHFRRCTSTVDFGSAPVSRSEASTTQKKIREEQLSSLLFFFFFVRTSYFVECLLSKLCSACIAFVRSLQLSGKLL